MIFSRNVESVEIVEFAMFAVKTFVASRAFVTPFRSLLHTGCGNFGYKVAVSIPRHRDNRASVLSQPLIYKILLKSIELSAEI